MQITNLEILTFLKEHKLHDLNDINYKLRFIRKNFKRLLNDRSMVITSTMVGTVIFVHKGNKYKRLKLTDFLVGHHLGEFSFTRKPFKYPIKKKKKILSEDRLGQISYPILNRFGYSMY